MSTRVVNCQESSYDVYIGRPSKWGNPFKIGPDGDREEVINKYRQWIMTQSLLLASLEELDGKRLGCWCAPENCHGHILVYLLEQHKMTQARLLKQRRPYG